MYSGLYCVFFVGIFSSPFVLVYYDTPLVYFCSIDPTYDREALAGGILRTMQYAEQAAATESDMQDVTAQIDDELNALAHEVMARSRTLNSGHEERVKPVRDYLKKTAVSLTATQQKEAASLAGSMGMYRRMTFGRARISNNETALDSLWGELNALDAELFPADATEGDMAAYLLAAADAVKPVYHTEAGFDSDEAAQHLAGVMLDAYLSLPGMKQAARDNRRYGQSVEKYRAARDAFAENSRQAFEKALRGIRGGEKDERAAYGRALRAKWISMKEYIDPFTGSKNDKA